MPTTASTAQPSCASLASTSVLLKAKRAGDAKLLSQPLSRSAASEDGAEERAVAGRIASNTAISCFLFSTTKVRSWPGQRGRGVRLASSSGGRVRLGSGERTRVPCVSTARGHPDAEPTRREQRSIVAFV